MRWRLSRGQGLAVLAEVRDVVHADREPLVLGLGDVAAAGNLEAAEVGAEHHLLLVGEPLIAEHEDGVLVHAGLDSSDLGLADRLGDVDAGHLAGEARRHSADGDRHGVALYF